MKGLYIKIPQPVFQCRLGNIELINRKNDLSDESFFRCLIHPMIPLPYFFIISSTALISWVSWPVM